MVGQSDKRNQQYAAEDFNHAGGLMDAPADRGEIGEANKPLTVRFSSISINCGWLAELSKWRQFDLLACPALPGSVIKRFQPFAAHFFLP